MLPVDIQNEIVAGLRVDKSIKHVFLFGSYARGTADPGSDVDIVVVLDRKDIRHTYAEMLKDRTRVGGYCNCTSRLSMMYLRRQRFNAARKTALALSDFLVKTYHANKVVLIGSLLDEHRFDVHSDIDLCVAGIASDSYFKAVGESLLQASPFDVDLIPMEHASERLNKHVSEGEVLYVKA